MKYMTEVAAVFRSTMYSDQDKYNTSPSIHSLAYHSQSRSIMLSSKCGIDNLRHGDDGLILLTLSHKLQSDRCILESLR
jgi:hypothetical protein